MEEERLDEMRESLNKNIQKNMAPHWRAHQSLKGWSAMNYPAIIQRFPVKLTNPPPKGLGFSNLH